MKKRMDQVEDLLRKNGPMLSGQLAGLLQNRYSISNDAARQAISRARSPIQKLKVFPYNKNQVFCYLEEHYKTELYRQRLYSSLKNESATVAAIICALENSNYIMRKDLLPVFSKSPIENTKGHRNFERVISDMIEQEIIFTPLDEYYAISMLYCGEEYNFTSSKSKEQILRIMVNDYMDWASKLNLISFNSIKVFPKEASFAHFKWFASAPSYITPLYDYKKERPGFVLVDAVFKHSATIEDVSFFVDKVNIIRNFKGLSAFAPVLILNSVKKETLHYLKENKIIIGILSNLFDKRYTEVLSNMYNVLCNATAILISEPQKIETLINEIAKNEGRFNNAMGDLFECMVGLFFQRIGCKYIEMNKLVSNGNGDKYEIDVYVEKDGKLYIIECKAYKGKLDDRYVREWLTKKILCFRKAFQNKQIVFSLWALGGFNAKAEELLRSHSETVNKYELTYFDKSGICEFARKYNDRVLCDQIKKHFNTYGVTVAE